MLLKNKIEKVKNILKADNVLTSLEERYCYSTDAGNFVSNSRVPDLVVFVETVEDVQKVVKYANEHEIPIVARGAGTNMVGSCITNRGGIVLNFSKMNKILEINNVNMTATVQPGVILGDLKTVIEQENLFFPPDPSNYKVSTIGGAIAQSSAGANAFKYGSIKNYILSLKVVTAEGKVMDLGIGLTKETVGYHLSQLMVGSEGTLAIIVEATLKLIPLPRTKNVICAYFSDDEDAIKSVNKLLLSNIYPSALDYMDKNSIITSENFANIGLNTDANCMLIIEIEGDECSIKEQISNTIKILGTEKLLDIKLAQNNEEIEQVWQARRVSYAATTRLAPDVISDDIIVPRINLLEMINACHEIIGKYNLKMCLVAHLGDGNLHPQIALDMDNEQEYRNYMSAKSEIYEKVLELKGSISAEHGIGIGKAEYITEMLDSSVLDYMKMIKRIFDPKNILNPGKIFDCN